jgi:hypothetical protein
VRCRANGYNDLRVLFGAVCGNWSQAQVLLEEVLRSECGEESKDPVGCGPRVSVLSGSRREILHVLQKVQRITTRGRGIQSGPDLAIIGAYLPLVRETLSLEEQPAGDMQSPLRVRVAREAHALCRLWRASASR